MRALRRAGCWVFLRGRFDVLARLYPPELVLHLASGDTVKQTQQAADRFADGVLLGDDDAGIGSCLSLQPLSLDGYDATVGLHPQSIAGQQGPRLGSNDVSLDLGLMIVVVAQRIEDLGRCQVGQSGQNLIRA